MKRGAAENPFGGQGFGAGKALRKEGSSKEQRREKFLSVLEALNRQFAAMVAAALAKDPAAPLVDAGNDYLQYVASLEERYLRPHGEVFTFGSGECGQLAHGVDEDSDAEGDARVLSILKPRIVASLRGKSVRLLACGGIHSVAVGDDGRVWTWGCNDDGALGRATGPIDKEDPSKGMKGNENFPALVEGGVTGEQVVHVACGDSQTLALTVDGDLWGWGCYKDKEGKKWFDLERPGDDPKTILRQQDEPLQLPLVPAGQVSDVACGASFNAALLKDGRVLTWGLGEVGDKDKDDAGKAIDKGSCLGRVCTKLRDARSNYLFERIAAEHLAPAEPRLKGGRPLPPAKSVGTGMWHLFVVGAEGAEVFTCGLNNYGQLGLGDELNRSEMEAVGSLSGAGVGAVGGGQHHSMAISLGDTGAVYTWGRSDYGQLGVGDPKRIAGSFEGSTGGAGSFLNAPVRVAMPSGAGVPVAMACGENHNLVLTDKRQAYSWGFGESGALGHAGDNDELSPRLVDVSKNSVGQATVLQITGGGQHSMLLARVLD